MPFLYIGIALLAVVIAFVIYAATRPADFQIQRSADLKASPDVLFAIINDLHQWHRWSPWEKLDPKMVKTFAGPPVGPGSSHEWTGNKKVGAGRNTILESTPGERVFMKLDMFRPFPCSNEVTFKLTPTDGGTHVDWIMAGNNGFMARAFGCIMDVDKMVGRDFEEGLANLDKAAQAETTRV